MNSRERVLTAISRKKPDRIPIYLWLTPLGIIILKAQCPMKGFTTIKDVEDYPFPEFNPVIDEMPSAVKTIQDKNLLACSSYEMGTFEQGHALMGMEELFNNMCINPEMVIFLFDIISEIKARIAGAFVEAGVDILWIGDDIGVQNGPVMDPKMWQEFLIPPLKKIINTARSVRSDIPFAYHNCGCIDWAVEGLIEAGVDILQSVQPEANDSSALKEKFCYYR